MNSTSSTRASDGRIRLILLLVAGLFMVWAGLEVAFDRLARYEETQRNHYLWFYEEWLQFLQRSDFAGRGDRMIFLGGASEAREGLLYETFDEAFPGMVAYQGSQSLGTMQSVLLQIDYMDRVYGRDAFPHRILIGVTPRFIWNAPQVSHTPIFTAINRYSPYWNVAEDSAEHYVLSPKTRLEAAEARYRFGTKQTRRYRNALRGVVHDVAARFKPSIADMNVLTVALKPYKYHHLAALPTGPHYAHFDSIEPVPYTVTGPDAQYARSEAARLREIAERNGSDVYVVAFPEGPWMKPHYPGTLQADYVELLRSMYGADHVLDLTHLLPETMFYDRSHPTLEGAKRITAAIIDWLKASATFAGP